MNIVRIVGVGVAVLIIAYLMWKGGARLFARLPATGWATTGTWLWKNKVGMLAFACIAPWAAPILVSVVWWCMLGAINFWCWTFGESTPQAQAHSAPAPPTIDRNLVHNTLFTEGAQKNGWEVIPLHKTVLYALPEEGAGSAVFSGISSDKLGPGVIKLTYPHGTFQDCYRMGCMLGSTNIVWYNQSPLCRTRGNGGPIVLQGETIRGGQSKTISVDVEFTPNNSEHPGYLLRTQKICQQLVVGWGPLPTTLDGKPLNWHLAVAFYQPNGLPWGDELKTHPATIYIGQDKDHDFYPCSTATFEADSGQVKKPGVLGFKCPAIPGGTLISVIITVH